jgi:hypothetical protein
MWHIVLTDEQARILASTPRPVQVRNSQGNIFGEIGPVWRSEDIEEAKRRLASDQPNLTTQQLLEIGKDNLPVERQ